MLAKFQLKKTCLGMKLETDWIIRKDRNEPQNLEYFISKRQSGKLSHKLCEYIE